MTATRSEIDVEVRYAETDQMGVVHHANYVIWFELARTSLCSLSGFHYAEIEALGYLLMVTGVEVRYHRPARYGEVAPRRLLVRAPGQPGDALRLRGDPGRGAAGHRRHRAHLDRQGQGTPPAAPPEALREPSNGWRESLSVRHSRFEVRPYLQGTDQGSRAMKRLLYETR